MAISLTNIINAIQAKSSATDSSSSISDILNLSVGSELVSDGAIVYDSSGVLPDDSSFIGGFIGIKNGSIYYRKSNAWEFIGKEVVAPYSFQGSVSGYSAGGFNNPLYVNTIDKFSFTTDGNATDVGDLQSLVGWLGTGQTSSTHGYATGGYVTTAAPVFYDIQDRIQKYAFASDGNATDTGALIQRNRDGSGASSSTHGYHHGGKYQSAPTTSLAVNEIQKFPFSANNNATDVGDLIDTNFNHAGQNSTTHGYASGGTPSPSPTRGLAIQKWTFSTDANATDVGDLLVGSTSRSGQSSTTHGYITRTTSTIEKFSFSSDGNATDVGDTIETSLTGGGHSSTENGYGGDETGDIEKFPFSTDANSTDVGDLTVRRQGRSSSQS